MTQLESIEPQIIITKSFDFEASHILPFHDGKCSRLHGHSYRLEVSLIGPVWHTTPPHEPGEGMVMDFQHISDVIKPEIKTRWDHYHLNDSVHPNPTAENLVSVWAAFLRLQFRSMLWKITLYETATSSATWMRDMPHE